MQLCDFELSFYTKLHFLSIRVDAPVCRQELPLSQGSPVCCSRDQWHFSSFSHAAPILSDLKCLQPLSQLSKYLLFQIIFVVLLRFQWSSFIESLCLSYTTLHKFPFDYTEFYALTIVSWVLCQLPKIISLEGGNGVFPLLNFNLSIILTRSLGGLLTVSFRNIFKKD